MNKNCELIQNYILANTERIFKEPSGDLKYPYIDPGAGYAGELWDWDAYWVAHSLCAMFRTFPSEALKEAGLTRARAAKYVQGSVLNFLAAQEENGYIPILVAAGGLFEGFFHEEYLKGRPLNQHKPFLCQMALLGCELADDDSWLDADKLFAYLNYYEEHQRDETSGLYVWQDDIMIGMDNNPTVFFRPERSSADVFLNSFLYLELRACAKLFQALGDGRAALMDERAERLKAAVNAEMWDEQDGLYFSQDVGFFRSERNVKGLRFHSGLAPKWNTLPLKIRFWGCFLPMYAGICSEAQAERMCKHLEDGAVFARYGVRSLAQTEKMYNLEKSNNPSNWLGAVWTVANYCVYKGLLRYGKSELAEKMRLATEELLCKAIRDFGGFYESYHPDTGEPFLYKGFLSFNLVAADMLQEGK